MPASVRRSTSLVLAVVSLAVTMDARPLPHAARPRVCATPPAPAVRSDPTAAGRDTVVLLGGPERLDGRFEDALGQPAWHGWTSVDHTAPADTFWSVSTFHAEALGGHGPGNRAMWCGTVFPGGDAGYGNLWHERLGWSWTLAEPRAVTVRISARLNHDLEPGYDFASLEVWRGFAWQTLAEWTGWRIDRAVDETVLLAPADLGGPAGNEIRLRFRVDTDETWSDEDGLYPTDGACQIDDIRVFVDGDEVTVDDFEPGTPVSWSPRFLDSVGDFAHLAGPLVDLDPCRDNGSVQVVFVDDGEVVPGTGGSPCLSWCYGPGGFVLNARGGQADGPVPLSNGIVSPPLAWPDGAGDLLLEFDVYAHEPLGPDSPGMVYRWRIRSTAEPDSTALADAPWRARDVVYAGGPAYRRHQELCGDLLVEAPRWVQCELAVLEVGTAWGQDGQDATPAPYFDNVTVKAFPAGPPRIVVDELHLLQDTFPAAGVVDLNDLSRNACRFDMARNISPREHLRIDPGDSLVAEVQLVPAGSQLVTRPRLLARLRANPLFDAVRFLPPDPDGMIDLVASGDSCRGPDGAVIPARWAFDLPDSGLFFPGDVAHFFLEARALTSGGEILVTWPADTNGFADFSTSSAWSAAATVRALPTLFSDAPGDQPRLLLWRDDPVAADEADVWAPALAALGLQAGVDYDLFRTRAPAEGAGNGLGGRAKERQIQQYDILLYDCGRAVQHTLGGGNWLADPSPDQSLLLQWFSTSGRSALFAGDNLASELAISGTTGALLLANILGVEPMAADAAPFLDGQRAPTVAVLPETGVFTSLDRWSVRGDCPGWRTVDLVLPAGAAIALAEFTAPDGSGGAYPYAAATRRVGVSPARDVISLPCGFAAIDEPLRGREGGDLPARVLVLADVLASLGQITTSSFEPVESRCALSPRPNPANPRAVLAYELPAPGPVELAIYDLRGRLVRTVVRGERPAGPSTAVWDGCDDRGRPCAAGVYIHVLRATQGTRRGKLTLVR